MKNTPATTAQMPATPNAVIRSPSTSIATSEDSSGPEPRASGYTTVRSALR